MLTFGKKTVSEYKSSVLVKKKKKTVSEYKLFHNFEMTDRK